KAILKGRILDYQKGMPNKGSLYFQDVIRDEAQEGKIRIQDDGTFYHEMNVFMVTPCMIRFPFGAVSYLLAPGETTSVVINLRENARKQSHLRQAEKPYGKEIYYGGYLAGVQQELADHPMSFSFTEGNSYEEYQQQIKKLNGKTAEEYKAQILARLPEFRKQITQSKGSPAYKEIINTDLELSAALKIIETERNLKLVHIMTNGLEGEKANKYYAETKIDIPQGYYESLQDFTYILSPKACYNSRYPILFDIIRRIGIDDKILKSLSNHTAASYLIQNLKAQMIGVSMRDLNPLNDKQKAELSTMPAAYNDMALAMNNDLLKQIEINKKKTGFTVNETGEVSNEDLFPSIISKFRGHTLLVDFWATWCGPCRSANKQILPMKEELKDKDIIYLYITGETSPLGTWKNMIPDIHGEHFRVTDEQWSYLREKFSIRGVPTYFVIDKEGNITYKQTGFPGVDTMKEQLMKALEK
ncbi:TlpA family protein disulfide reductase, partial [Bacteroides thetaiotaomicron]